MTIDAQRHSAEMAAQRAQELAGDDRLYRLRKACAVRAVDLYDMLHIANRVLGFYAENYAEKFPAIDQLLKEIEHAAE